VGCSRLASLASPCSALITSSASRAIVSPPLLGQSVPATAGAIAPPGHGRGLPPPRNLTCLWYATISQRDRRYHQHMVQAAPRDADRKTTMTAPRAPTPIRSRARTRPTAALVRRLSYCVSPQRPKITVQRSAASSSTRPHLCLPPQPSTNPAVLRATKPNSVRRPEDRS